MNNTFLHLKISRVKTETQDTKTFYLQTTGKSIAGYKAGQFLTFIFHHQKKEIRRSYSLGSSPRIDEEMFITVKKKINGEISRLFFYHFRKDDELTALPAAGRFILGKPVVKKYFFIAAGSGITPVFALIKQLLFHHPETEIFLLNQCRDENSIIYKTELYALRRQFDKRFLITEFFNRPKMHKHISQHLNNDILINIIKHETLNLNLKNFQFYLCGPTNFMRMAQFTLKLIGFTDSQIHKEQFVIEASPLPPLLTDKSEKNVTIHFNKKVYNIKAAYPKSILDAALEKNIQLPFSCKAGSCSTCVAKCLKGKVVMSANEVLTEKDIANGLVLTCVGYAITDLELEF